MIEEEAHPDLKVLLGKSFKSVWAEILYQKHTGRKEDTELKAVDVNTGKEIATYRFQMTDNERTKRQAAAAFVEALKKKLAE